jgi:hypothetical protein
MIAKFGRCCLTAVLSEDGQKVVEVCTSPYGYPFPTSISPVEFDKKRRSNDERKLQTMACDLTTTVIFNSQWRKQQLEETLRIREELAKQAYDTANKEKAERWILKAKEKNHQP